MTSTPWRSECGTPGGIATHVAPAQRDAGQERLDIFDAPPPRFRSERRRQQALTESAVAQGAKPSLIRAEKHGGAVRRESGIDPIDDVDLALRLVNFEIQVSPRRLQRLQQGDRGGTPVFREITR